MSEARMTTPFLGKRIPFLAAGTAMCPMQAVIPSVATITRTHQAGGSNGRASLWHSDDHGTATRRDLAEVHDPNAVLAKQAETPKRTSARLTIRAKLFVDLTMDLGEPAKPATGRITKP